MNTTKKVRRGAMAVVAAVTMAAGALALTLPASAGEPWPGEVVVEAGCVEGQGVVYVDIFDDFSAEYDVALLLGSDIIDLVEATTDTDEGENTIEFGPLEDGTYTVIVDWIQEQSDIGFLQIFDGDVTVDCVPDDTTTTSTTAVSPSSTSTAAPAAAAAAAATPRFTG
ncbi:hypothetical protein [Rhabdothermincola salaria]|uniref:hypothetical protein n=1 Tax=Rhabdothermincola salaria TaxID=2903142 RepID=UPI001E4EE0FC|nr:hypothetical protein [Rhabdothermincola salaria]MCD9622872.1 hypothetical protein [Rhabdothermincola salaria]